MKNEKRGIILIIILLTLGLFYVSAAEYASIDWNFKGQWPSGSFGDINVWHNVVDLFITVMLNTKIVHSNGHLALSTLDNLGNEKILDGLAHFNNETCELKFGMNFSTPIGVKSELVYDIAINGDKNICHFKDYQKYINQTLREVLLDLGAKNANASFTSKNSNITLTPGQNYDVNHPKFDVTISFPKNNNYDLIPDSTNYTSVNLTTLSLTEINLTTIQNITYVSRVKEIPEENESGNGNNTKKTTTITLEILNPDPKNTSVIMNLGDRKAFSIENTDYEVIKWYLDGSVVENDRNKYEFRAVKEGSSKLKVEIKKETLTKSYTWSIRVGEEKKKAPVNLIIFVLIGVVIILAMFIIGYFIFKKSSGD